MVASTVLVIAPRPLKSWNPFGQWCRRNGVSEDEVVARVAEQGRRCCRRYVRQVWLGHRVPSFELCKAFSGVTCGELSAVVIREWRWNGRRAAA